MILLTDGRTDGQTGERHTIIRPKFYFGRIINKIVEVCYHLVRINIYDNSISYIPYENNV